MQNPPFGMPKWETYTSFFYPVTFSPNAGTWDVRSCPRARGMFVFWLFCWTLAHLASIHLPPHVSPAGGWGGAAATLTTAPFPNQVIVLFGSVVTNIKADRVCFGYDDDAKCGGFGGAFHLSLSLSLFLSLALSLSFSLHLSLPLSRTRTRTHPTYNPKFRPPTEPTPGNGSPDNSLTRPLAHPPTGLAYAIACSAISIFVALYALLTPKLRLPWGALEMKVSSGPLPRPLAASRARPAPPPRRPRQHVAAFLTVWWVVGTSCFTFIAPFTIVGNGYFGSCLATFASVSLLCRYGTAQPRPTPLWCTPHALQHIPRSLQGLTHAPCQPGILQTADIALHLHSRPPHALRALPPVPKLSAALSASVAEDVGKLLCASVVNLMACVSVCSSESCINERAWGECTHVTLPPTHSSILGNMATPATHTTTCDLPTALACSGVSVLVCATVFATKDKLPVDKISVFLSLWWTCGTGTMTFRSPFVEGTPNPLHRNQIA